jgi:dihydrofolate reductase
MQKTKVSIIAAMDEKRGIGKDNKIPWHLKDDLIKLKRLTKDHLVILGRKTYDSMVFYYNRTGNPMPGKLYIVVTHDKNYKPARENAQVAHSLDEAVSFARSHLAKLGEIFIIGGGQIFQQALPLVDKLYLTIVEARLDSPPESPARRGDFNCDAFFPEYSEFKKIISEEEKEGEGYKYKFLELER